MKANELRIEGLKDLRDADEVAKSIAEGNRIIEKSEAEEAYKVLLLASYCGDNPNCTNDLPCEDCLKMCNVATATGIKDVVGGLDYLKQKYRK